MSLYNVMQNALHGDTRLIGRPSATKDTDSIAKLDSD